MRSAWRIGATLVVGLAVGACGGNGGAAVDSTSVWERLPDPPLSPRSEAAVAWTGEEILVVGGNTFVCGPTADCVLGDAAGFSDGAALDPVTETWRPIAAAPAPIWSASPVRLGRDVFFLTTSDPRDDAPVLFGYDVDADAWATIELPEGVIGTGLVATDAALVLYSVSDELGPVDDWQLDPVTGEWEVLQDDPLGPGFDRHYVSHGEDLYLFDKALVPSPGGEDGPALVRAARLRDGAWELLPTGEMLGGGSALVAGSRIVFPALGCSDGGEVNGYGRCIPHGAVFDTELDRWTELPNPPGRGQKDASSAGAVSADVAVIWSTGHPYLDTSTDTWLMLPALDDGSETSFQRWVHGVGPYGFVVGGAEFSDAAPGGALLGDAWIWNR